MSRLPRPSWWPAVLALATLLAVAPRAWAQPAPPRIGYVYPAGGRQGDTFQVTLGGQRLDGAANVHVSGAGVQAKVLEYTKPLTPNQANESRERLQELRNREKDAETLKEMADIRAKLLAFRNKAGPAIAETVTLQVTVAADAEPGKRELRLATPTGLSNPLVFCVGQLPEFREPAPKPGDAPGDLKGLKGPNDGKPPRAAAPRPDVPITLPAIVNGRIMPGEVDRYRFPARQGQRLVVAAGARDLIPYLADAVPGWFQATLTLYDAKGREVAYDDDYAFRPDPVLLYEVPADGDYVVAIRDAVYRGREDFVYRIALGELPFVTGVFPLGGKVGTQTAVEVTGWNLPPARLTQDNRLPGIHPLAVRAGELLSNREPFAVDTLPECLEKEPNNDPGHAQGVALPVIVNGRIDSPGDRDVFSFEGRAGDEIVAEVCARRLDSPLDSALKLTDAGGRQLAFNDDHEDKGSGLNTHHADSWLRAALPAGGTYYLHLGDAQQKGGPAYAYRVRVGPPQPDFALRVVPSSISVRPGATVPLTAYALRKDGFAGEIALALKDAPAGFALGGGRVPAGQDRIRFTLTAPPTPLKESLPLALEGQAALEGRQVVRPAVPAEDMMQAFAYRHLVPAEEMRVVVSGVAARGIGVRLPGDGPVRIPAGGTVRVAVGLPPGRFFDRIEVELSEPPDGITLREASPAGARSEIVIQSDAAKVKPGLRGNLIVSVFGTRTRPLPEKAPASPEKAPSEKTPPDGKAPAPPEKAPATPEKAPPDGKPPAPPAKAPAAPRRVLISALPAIPFEIVAP